MLMLSPAYFYAQIRCSVSVSTSPSTLSSSLLLTLPSTIKKSMSEHMWEKWSYAMMMMMAHQTFNCNNKMDVHAPKKTFTFAQLQMCTHANEHTITYTINHRIRTDRTVNHFRLSFFLSVCLYSLCSLVSFYFWFQFSVTFFVRRLIHTESHTVFMWNWREKNGEKKKRNETFVFVGTDFYSWTAFVFFS